MGKQREQWEQKKKTPSQRELTIIMHCLHIVLSTIAYWV